MVEQRLGWTHPVRYLNAPDVHSAGYSLLVAAYLMSKMVVVARLSKISPLKDPPLHNPGQSLDARLDELRDRKILLPIITAVFLILLAGLEWLRWYSDTLPQPRVYSFLAIGYAIYVASTIRRSCGTSASDQTGSRRGARRGAISRAAARMRLKRVSRHHWTRIQPRPRRGRGPGDLRGRDQDLAKAHAERRAYPFDGTAFGARGYTPDEIRSNRCWHRQTGCATWKESTASLSGRASRGRGWIVESAATAEAKKRGLWLLNPKALPSFILPSLCNVRSGTSSWLPITFHASSAAASAGAGDASRGCDRQRRISGRRALDRRNAARRRARRESAPWSRSILTSLSGC